MVMRIRLVKAEHQQFISDSAVGLFSIAVLGLAGLLINVVIARYYDAAVLGAFNQVFAIYILGSQFAVFGVQSSVLKYAAQHNGDDQELRAILRAGLIIVAAIALVVSLGLFAVRNAIGAALDSAEVARGVGYAAPGLWAFALNKYLLNTLNGLRRMKAYSLFSSLRYGLLLTVVAGAAAMGVPGGVLPVIFTFAETLLLLTLFLHLRSLFSGRVAHGSTRTWCRAHLQFGLRSVTGGAVSELNTRIDVLVLGIFAEDRIVGIFSFAAILAEGLLQIPLVIKRQADPILTPLILRREHDMLTASFRTWRRWKGTPIRQRYLDLGYVHEDDLASYDVDHAVVDLPGLSAETLKLWRLRAFVEFYGRPSVLFRNLRNVSSPDILKALVYRLRNIWRA